MSKVLQLVSKAIHAIIHDLVNSLIKEENENSLRPRG